LYNPSGWPSRTSTGYSLQPNCLQPTAYSL